MTAGATLGSTVGCAPGAAGAHGGRNAAQGHTHPDMDAYLGNLDSKLEQVRNARFVEGFVDHATGKPATPESRERLAPSETLFRNMLHTLLLTQSFRDASEEIRFHPGMQKRMTENIDSMDATVLQVNDMLANLTPEQRESTRDHLRKHPGLAMRLAESLDEQAALAGVGASRRIQLRSMMTQASFRLSKNDPGVVIDEYVNKVRRATAPGKGEIAAAANAGYLGSEAFWKYRESLEKSNGAMADDASRGSFTGPGSGAVKVGAKLLGIGAVTFGISAIFVSNEVFPFVIGMTVGAILFAIGLITLIVGAIIYGLNRNKAAE